MRGLPTADRTPDLTGKATLRRLPLVGGGLFGSRKNGDAWTEVRNGLFWPGFVHEYGLWHKFRDQLRYVLATGAWQWCTDGQISVESGCQVRG